MNRTFSSRGNPVVRNKQADLERKIDDLERRLQDKIEISSGFSDPEMKIRKLEQAFKFFDRTTSNYLDFLNFFAALTKLNFIGVQREIEGLFNRYDDDATGFVNYSNLSRQLFGLGGRVILDQLSREIVENLKVKIITRNGPSGIHIMTHTLQRYANDVGEIDRSNLEYIFNEYINTSNDAFQRFLDSFDPENTGKVSNIYKSITIDSIIYRSVLMKC